MVGVVLVILMSIPPDHRLDPSHGFRIGIGNLEMVMAQNQVPKRAKRFHWEIF